MKFQAAVTDRLVAAGSDEVTRTRRKLQPVHGRPFPLEYNFVSTSSHKLTLRHLYAPVVTDNHSTTSPLVLLLTSPRSAIAKVEDQSPPW